MNRSLKLSMVIAIALGSTQTMAETLGPVHVKSTLSQPLLAEIPINAASPAELRSITVQLASLEDFTRAGIVGGRPNVPLTFSVVTSNNQPVIRITSVVAVDDPYLDLLLEVNGGSGGKIIREFAILLDPLKNAPEAVATSPRKSPARAAHGVARTAPAPARHVAAARSEAPSATPGKGQYGPVKSGDTLTSIARDSQLSGVSLNQMLMALKQANPDAFYRDNINTLKRGAILRIPTASEAQSLAVVAAIAEVHRQNSDWRTGTIGKPTTVADSATRASASSAPTTAASKTDSDRLALVPTTQQNGASGPGNKTGGKSDTSAEGVRQELQRTQESLSSVQQQSDDLKVRLQDLTEINGKNVKLLSLKDSEIADLEKKLAAARKTAGLPAFTPAAPASVASAVATPAALPAGAGSAAATMAAGPLAAPAAAGTAAIAPVVAASVAAKAKPAPIAITPMPVKPAPVIAADEPWYMQSWAWAAGVIAVVIIALLALLSRRRKAKASFEGSPTSSLADRFVPESTGHDSADTDQNELLDQLAEHPDDIGLHLELVALYYSRRDVDHFEAAAEAMHAHITDTDQNEWQDVVHMGEDLAPGHPLFDHHPELPSKAVKEARPSFDLDDYSSDAPAAQAAPQMPPLPTPPVKKVSEYNFNFDLTTPGSGAPGARGPGEAATAPAVSDAELRDVPASKPTTSWDFDKVEAQSHGGASDDDFSSSHISASDDFNDDPVDTKLDLARAYVDMGDPDGARAMLGEVIKEGSQIQRDIAKRLLETLS